MKSLVKFSAVLALALAFAFAAPKSEAQSHNRRLILQTSFPFTVENHEIPAGIYEITFQDGWLRMQTGDGQAVTSILTLPVSGKSNEGGARAVFHRYHNRYFLSQVWLAASDRGRQTLESGDEHRSRKLEAPQVVVVQLTRSEGQSR
jgi:hypothetical protein